MPGQSWRRADHLRRLSESRTADVLVVGGGVIGCGVALDLSARGFEVVLVEQADFASGTSGRSTKLFHGGIRYLPQFRFQLVAEGLREQRVLAEIADYLFAPLEFVVPVYDQFGLADAPAWAATGRRASVALAAGLTVYDLLGGLDRPGDRHERLDLEEVSQAAPKLRKEGLRGGFSYWDAQTDDSRLVIAVARTAVSLGATAVNRIRARTATRKGAGFVVEMVDQLSGETWSITARAVVVATGAFDPISLGGTTPLEIVRSKGAHVIVDRETVGLDTRALVLPKTDDNRVMFLIPWAGKALIGTTDTPFHGQVDHPITEPEDVEYLVEHVERYLDVSNLSPISTFAGLRALADDDETESTASASREHVISEPVPGFYQVAGGKLTTYRRISAGIADRVSRHLGSKVKSTTEELKLVGAGIDPVDSLTRRYGIEAVSAAGSEETPLLGDQETFLGEARHAIGSESAVTIGDFALRRTRLALLSPSHGRSDATLLASVFGEELGWSQAERVAQVRDFEAELEAEGL